MKNKSYSVQLYQSTIGVHNIILKNLKTNLFEMGLDFKFLYYKFIYNQTT